MKKAILVACSHWPAPVWLWDRLGHRPSTSLALTTITGAVALAAILLTAALGDPAMLGPRKRLRKLCLWGQDASPLYGKSLAFGDSGRYVEVCLPH